MELREARKLLRRLFLRGGEDWQRIMAFLDERVVLGAVPEREIAQLEKMLALPPREATS